jgi:hypothetical protein
MFDKIFSWIIQYLHVGLDFLATHLLTFEAIIGLMFGVFFLGLLSRVRS